MEYSVKNTFESIELEDWHKLVKNSPYGSVFQYPQMYEFWNKQPDSSVEVFAVYSNEEKLLALCLVVIQHSGLIVKKYFSRRAIVYGGPVFADECDQESVLAYLLQQIEKSLRSKAIYIEFRNATDYSAYDHVFKQERFDYVPYQNFKIPLNEEEVIFSNLTSEKRRQIRRSFREGVEISFVNSDENINGVYKIIYDIYLHKVKKPLPSIEFFRNLAKMELGNVVALIFEKKVIGGGFLVYDNNTVYDWYRGGMDREYKHQYPSTVAAWAAIQFGLKKKLKEFDFMGAGIKGEDYGVRKFKAQFGGELVEHGRYFKVYKPLLYEIAKSGFSFMNKIS